MKKNIGVTLLIGEKRKKKIRASLVSFIFEYISVQNLKDEINKKVFELNWTEYKLSTGTDVMYFGIEDMFLTAGSLSHGSMLGKSSLDEFNSLEKSHKLVKSIEKYNLIELLNNEKCDYISELLYFYDDKKNNDFFTISAKFYLEKRTLFDALKDIKKNANLYKNKIVEASEKKENLEVSRLKFIGVEDICQRSKLAIKYGAYEVFYRDFDSVTDLIDVLPDQNEIFKIL